VGGARVRRTDQLHPEVVVLDSSALPLYLTEAEIEKLLTPADGLQSIEACFGRLDRGVIRNRPRTRMRAGEGAFAVMSAVDEELGLAGLKSYTWQPGGTPFVVVLFDLAEAEVAAVIEADRLGQLRTGAASGVAAKHLAKEDARTLGVIGCGWQAESQVACIREALPGIERVVAYCRTEEKLRAFCEKVGAEPGESHRDPAEQDIVVTVTTSKDPVLRGEWLKDGALVCAVGANEPQARELDNVVLERAVLVCCDSLEQAKLESGDLIEPVERGVLDWLEVHELQEVVAGELPGRSSPDDIVVFKSNGIAAWDVAIGATALQRAHETKVGREL
jgi:ornithine cyclodeaminase/alanine dehydrogenase-like protein (mu-crystallin family)